MEFLKVFLILKVDNEYVYCFKKGAEIVCNKHIINCNNCKQKFIALILKEMIL